jgi:hypothetical protein
MRQLNRELGGADPAAIRHDAAERVLAVIRIKPKATMGDAAVTLDMRRFDHQETRAGIRKHSEMRHVPVVTDAVIGAVLAHRRNDDPVRKVEIDKFYGREQSARHRSSHAQLEGGTQFERADLALNEFCVLWIARWRPKSRADRESGARRFQPITRERMCW